MACLGEARGARYGNNWSYTRVQLPDSIMQNLPPEARETIENFQNERDSLQNLLGSDSTMTVDMADSIFRSTIMDSLYSRTFPGDSTSSISGAVVDSVKKYGDKNFLDFPIFLDFADSLIYIPADKDVFMYKSGKVNYQNMELSADYIKLNTTTKNVDADGQLDTTTMERSKVNFTEGPTEYIMDSMVYNMDSGKALIYGVVTEEGEGIMYGGTVKKMKDNVTHMHAGRYTTCDAECPHFYLQMTKATVIPGKYTIFGPSYMVFEDVPLYPITIPFGFFPQQTERNSGIIFPTYGEETVRGFYMQDAGYYFAINDYVDLKLTGSIYSLGSWDFKLNSNYAWRYKFKGSVGLSYAETVAGEYGSEDYSLSSGFKVTWSHTQDSKFSPSSTFSASVDFTSNSSYNKYNSTDLSDMTTTTSNSTIAYSKSWSGTPMSLSANATYSMNNQDTTLTMSFPNITFNVSSISPFERKNATGSEKWYEKISFTYNMQLKNSVTSLKQSEFFKEEMWNTMKTGMKHTIPVSASFSIGGVFNVTPSFNYNETWYLRKTERTWNPSTETVDYDTINGFYRISNYTLAVSMNTKLYGTYTVGGNKSGTKKPAIFRHVLTPTVSLSYAPDYGAESYGYWKTVQSSAEGATTKYSPYSDGIFGTSSSSATAAVSFSLANTLEAKIPSDYDTTGYKKISIIDALSISSSYNFLADSLNLANFSVSLRIPVVTGYTLSLSATLDPYAVQDGKKVNRFMVEEGGLARLTSLSFSAGYGFKSKSSGKTSNTPSINNPATNNSGNRMSNQMQGDFFAQEAMDEGVPLSAMDLAYAAAGQYYDFAIPWSLNVNYSFSYSKPLETESIIQTVNASGSVSLTDKWAISGGIAYDLQDNEFTPSTVQITRDLHCWQLSFSWVPVGTRQSWSFTLQAKSSMLSDVLKWDKESGYSSSYYY